MLLNQSVACVAAVAAAMFGSSAEAGALREWRFNVSLDDKPIGEHRYVLRSTRNASS